MNHDALWMPVLDIGQPGLVAITGPSGAGKSTLIELLAGTLGEAYTGSVRVLGKEWSELRSDRSRQFHLRRIGLIPQDLGLLPNQTPRQMLCQALLDAAVPKTECNDRAMRALSQMELEAFADRRIADMSGGQRQRVAIARALARNVELILADEPTANLNTQLSDDTIAILKRIGRLIPVMVVTHDPRIAHLCDDQIKVAPPPVAAPLAAGVSAAPSGVDPAAMPGAVEGAATSAWRSHRRLAFVSTAATCGVALTVALFARPAGPTGGPAAMPAAGVTQTQPPIPVIAAAPAVPASSPSPTESAAPPAAPVPAAPVPAGPAVAAVAQTKVLGTAGSRTLPKTTPIVPAEPVVEVAPPVPEAPAQLTQATVQPSSPTVPAYLQWWQMFMGVFGGTPSPKPTPPPPATWPGHNGAGSRTFP
jgi:putative ABC transport system ATP-binding protein